MNQLMFTLDMLKEHWKYYGTSGEQYDGVTRVVKVLDKPALVQAAHKLGKQGISLEEAWYSGAANRGKVAHGRIEAWVRQLPFDDSDIPGELMDQSEQSLERFKGWWGAEGFVFVDAEYLVSCDLLRVGGALDLLAKHNGALALVDMKTAKGFYPEHKLQVVGYKALVESQHRTNPTKAQVPSAWVEAKPMVVDEVWVARVGNEEPGDMDGMQLSPSEVALHRDTFLGLAANHYNLKRVMARR